MSLLWLCPLLLPAQAGELDRALERMATAPNPSYLDARADVVAHGPDALRARVAAAEWTDVSWHADAMAAIALTWLEQPDACARVYELRGINPAVYLARRRPRPEVGRELRRLRAPAPILLEALLRPLHRFSTRDDFPERSVTEATRLMAEERAALRVGLLVALGRSQHAVARFALARVAFDASAPDHERRAAAIALGEAGGRVALLARVAENTELSPWLRGGAVIGIAKAARVSPEAAVVVLRRFLTDTELRRPAISGLAIAGSAWGPADDAVRAEIAELLVRALRDHAAEEAAVLEALAVVDHPVARARLEALRRDTDVGVRARAEHAWSRLRR